MKNLSIIGRPGSKSIKNIVKITGIPKYRKTAKVLINYGLAGKKMEQFIRNFPSARGKYFINQYVGCSKYKAVKEAEKQKIKVPKTYMVLPNFVESSNFLTKRLHSQGGIGIAKVIGKTKKNNEYFQEFISDRRYELRVHAFAWIPQEEWVLQKRFGLPNEIAWNFHNGGRFQSIKSTNGYNLFKKAKEISQKILKIRKMAFGAVDLIVNSSGEIYFIEINSAPGFTGLSQPIYVNAFNKLKSMAENDVLRFCNKG